MSRLTPSDEARFFAKVDRSGGPGACWLWTACTYGGGYGSFGLGGRTQYAHRVAYELEVGPIPGGLHVLHRCDVRRCVNPAHLFLGTNADNAADMVSKGRQSRGAEHRATAGGPKTAPNASKYRGVHWREDRQKWQAHIHVADRKLYLGYYESEDVAADAYALVVALIEAGETDRATLRQATASLRQSPPRTLPRPRPIAQPRRRRRARQMRRP